MQFKTLILFLFLLLFSSANCLADSVIEIKGVDENIEKNIISFLSSTNINCELTKVQIGQYIESIPKKIKTAIRPFGYYNAKIYLKNTPKTKDCLKIQVEIDLGQPVIINNLDIKISSDQHKQFSQLSQKTFSLKKGEVLVDSVYEDFKSNLFEKATELGFLDAKFIVSKIDVFPNKNQANITLHFDTGLRYKIEKIEIIQTPFFLSDRFIKKFVTIKKEQHFTNSQLFNLRKKLANTGYFEQVSIELDFNKKNNGLVPLKILLTPGDRIKYSMGVGFSTDEGPRILFDYNQYRVTDYGYQFNSKLTLSEVISEVTAGLKMPSKSNPISKWYNLELGYRRERTDSTSSDTSKLGISQTRIHDNKWQNINFIDLVDEQFTTGVEENNSTLLVPGTSWSFTKADNPRLPMKGYKIQAELKGASNSLVSDASFAQFDFSYKAIFPIKNKNRLIYRGTIGTTFIDDLSLLPTSYRYYSGGDNSIRGYNYNTLSPINNDGDAIGGKHLFVSSIEYEHRIANQWGVAVFSDFGNAFTSNFKFKKSVGVGGRWFSPIGPVRLDIGIPLDDDQNNFQIHITIGSDF